MNHPYSIALLALLIPSAALDAQDNPFALTGGSVKSAHVVYEVKGKPNPDNPTTGAFTVAEVGVAPDRWLMRMVAPFEHGGKRDTMTMIMATNKDSQYTYMKMGGTTSGDVSVILRPHLAREYAALNAGGKSRFKENLRLLTQTSSSGIDEEYITILGDKKGSETVAGHKCDIYQHGKTTLCVMPNAPGVVLRSSNTEDGMDMVAKKVTLNGPVPSAASFLPKGVRWTNQGYAFEEFAPQLWEMKKQSDPSKVPPAGMAKFVVAYLASPVAGKEIKEMGAVPGMGGDDESAAVDEAEDDSTE